MKFKNGVDLKGLHLLMRPVLRVAEALWLHNGQTEGVTITSSSGGCHSATSWHYYGLALDLRTRYFTAAVKQEIANQLKAALPAYDVVVHSTHIHVEIGNALAKKHDLLT